MGPHRGKREQKSKESTCNTKPAVASSVPSIRGLGYIPKAKSPSSLQIVVTSMPSSEVTVFQDDYGVSLKSNQKYIAHSCNCHCCKKDEAIHIHFHHITDTSIPTSFIRYTTDFISSNIVVVDGLTIEENDLDAPFKKLPLPWIALSVRNRNLFVPTIHHVNPSLRLKYNSNDGVTKFAFLPKN